MALSLSNSRILYCGAAFAALCIAISGGPAGAKATFVTFDTAQVAGINAAGTVTGWAGGANSFVRTADGTMTLFAVPGGTSTFATSINAGGTVTGYYCDGASCNAPGSLHGFLRTEDGTITTFDPRGASHTYPASINAKGDIAGYYADSDSNPHGFLRSSSGKIKIFDVPGALSTIGNGVNDKGAIVGYYVDANGVAHGFVRAPDGSITTIDGSQAVGTLATAINIQGVIAGYYGDSNGVTHGFVRTPDGTMTTFEDPSCQIGPFGINRKGIVTGSCSNLKNSSHDVGFVRKPNGKIKKFHVPDGGSTAARGINDSGVVAGSYRGGGFLRFP